MALQNLEKMGKQRDINDTNRPFEPAIIYVFSLGYENTKYDFGEFKVSTFGM